MSKNKTNKPSSSTSREHSEEVLKLAEKIEESFKQLAEILEEAVELDYKLRAGQIRRNTPQFR